VRSPNIFDSSLRKKIEEEIFEDVMTKNFLEMRKDNNL
jgi:hypothetical protein